MGRSARSEWLFVHHPAAAVDSGTAVLDGLIAGAPRSRDPNYLTAIIRRRTGLAQGVLLIEEEITHGGSARSVSGSSPSPSIASFTRTVLLRIFAYTKLGAPPHPLDLNSIAEAIWQSDWGNYTPQNADYMASFLMQPASSLADVQAQLAEVWPELQRFVEVESRILTAAFRSMPRTAIGAQLQLFSGQLDICQLGTKHYGIEFLECRLNAGPVGTPLTIPLKQALETFAAPGQVITTKMVWSFGNSMSEAMTYQNGIVLVANPPKGAWVWEAASYITPLSDGPTKIEYTFAPGTRFLVQSVEVTQVNGKQVTIIELQVLDGPG